MYLRFNRYIVECKSEKQAVEGNGLDVLIDTQWNVNRFFTTSNDNKMTVLIDTQWNVNRDKWKLEVKEKFVLIDTQWNVNNDDISKLYIKCYGFNRYIVECKLSLTFLYAVFLTCFNRYIVECKLYIYSFYQFRRPVLIDTQWNVNFNISVLTAQLQSVLIDTQWNVNKGAAIIFPKNLQF